MEVKHGVYDIGENGGPGGSGRISRGGVGEGSKTYFSLILQLKTVPGPRWRALGRGWGW